MAKEKTMMTIGSPIRSLPYCLKKVDDKIGGWIILNRDYKPLALNQGQGKFIRYEDVPRDARVQVSEDERKKIQIPNSSNDAETFYLYNDSTHPALSKKHWDRYSQKLLHITKLKGLWS